MTQPDRTTLTIAIRNNARPNTPEGKALRIAQKRLRDGQSATEILLEALLNLENVPAPKQGFMDQLRNEIVQVIRESLVNFQPVEGSNPPHPTPSETSTGNKIKGRAAQLLRRLTQEENEDD